jgi:hypothetical protein
MPVAYTPTLTLSTSAIDPISDRGGENYTPPNELADKGI